MGRVGTLSWIELLLGKGGIVPHCLKTIQHVKDLQEEKKEAAPAEEHPDDVGKRIAAQWTADPSAVGDDAVPQDADDGSAPGAAHDGQPVSPDKEAAGSEQEHPQSVIERLKGTVKSITTALSGSSEDSQALADAKYVVKELTEASKAAVQAHNKKSGELKDIEAQLKAAQQLLAIVCFIQHFACARIM